MTENSLVLSLKGQVSSGKQALKALHSHCSWPQLDPISLSQICWEGYSLIHVLHVTSFLVIALRLASLSLPPSLLPTPSGTTISVLRAKAINTAQAAPSLRESKNKKRENLFPLEKKKNVIKTVPF